MLLSKHPHFKLALFSACEHGSNIFAATHQLNPILCNIPVVKYFDFSLPTADMDQDLFNGDHCSTLLTAQRELWLTHNKIGHIYMR